jgi:hypothetical protein
VRGKEKGALPVRLGTGSSIVASGDHRFCDHRSPSSSLITQYPVPISLYIFIYLGPNRSSLPRRASAVHLRSSTLARPLLLVESSLHPSLPRHPSLETRDWKLKLEPRNWGRRCGICDPRHRLAGARARKTARGTCEIGQLVPRCCSLLELHPKVTGNLTENG